MERGDEERGDGGRGNVLTTVRVRRRERSREEGHPWALGCMAIFQHVR